MTPILRHICGSDICIICKYRHIHLNRFRKNIVSDLQKNSVGRHAQNTAYSTTSAEHYKEKVFPDDFFYMLPSKMQINVYHVLLLNLIKLFI